jgi:very-short-patch-repair endonuclease
MVACAPWGAAGEFAASHHGVLTRSQAAARGISKRVVDRLLRDESIDEPIAGVFDGYPPGPIELLVPSGRHARTPGVLFHRGPMGAEHANDFTVVDAIRCTGIARTLCDIGSVDPFDKVQTAFESVWRNGHSLTWLSQTAERLHRPGQRGTGVILNLLDGAASHVAPTESALESFLERILIGVPGLVRQHSILDPSGRFVARVDFAVPELKIAIEAHSRRHHFGLVAEERDADRESDIQAQGWIVRYVTKSQAARPTALRSSLLALINARRAA